MQTLSEKQRTLARLDMSMHEIEDVDMYKQSIIQYITLLDSIIVHDFYSFMCKINTGRL